jgi:hypothetical protein
MHRYFVTGRSVRGAGWPIRSCKGNALAGTLAGLVLVASALASSGHAPLPVATAHGSIHGTVTKIDAPMLRLHMRTDDDRRVDLTVANVDALRTVRRGDHVRVDVDDHDIVLNINTTLPPPRPMAHPRG